MGQGSWSKDAYNDISTKRSTMSFAENFTQQRERKTHSDLSPVGIDIRESRDSAEHPNSIAIIVALDVTGSMRDIPSFMITKKLGALMNTIIENGIPDPQIMFMAIGDHISDNYPLQVAQFESGTKELDASLEKIYIEGGGGGTNEESYGLAWYFAAKHTSIDCFEKRGEKGFIFTIGDEAFHEKMQAHYLKSKVGYDEQEDLSAKAMFDLASNSYNIFHINVEEGAKGRNPEVRQAWQDLLNQNLLKLENKDLVAELIATTVAMMHGVHIDKATESFDAATKSSVSNALAVLKDSIVSTKSASSGVIAL